MSDIQRQYEPSAPSLSAFSSLEDLNITASNTLGEEEEKALKILDEVLDDNSGYSSGCSTTSSSLSGWSDTASLSSTDGYDIVYTSRDSDYEESSRGDNDIPLPPLQSEEGLETLETIAELDNLTEPAELSTHLKVSNPDEAEATNTANDLDDTDLGIDLDIESDDADITAQQVILPSTTQTTSLDQETLLKKAEALSYISHEELRTARKVASNHIKQRMFERNMLVAVAAGDESESDQSQILGYSVWSSGAFGTAKQKVSNNSNGYSSKILGGSIGADVKFENDLLLGVSFSKIRSNIKHANQTTTKKLNTYIASIYGTSPIKENLTLGVIGSAGFSPKPRSKLLSLESHLNYQIELPQDIKLLPNIGFKYEYERSKTHQEQIDSNVSIAHAKKSYQALSGEIGSRVIFAPIKLKEVGTSNVILSNTILTPTAHFSVERRIGSRGVNSPYHLTYQGIGQEVVTGILAINPQHQKTSLNAGIGLIASIRLYKAETI